MRVGFLVCFIVALLVTGCAAFRPTPYQPSVDGDYGYNDKRIGPGEYRITVSGNATTSAQMLWEQLLYRAAEITLAHGRDHFVVMPIADGQLVNIKPAFLMPQFGIGPGAAITGVHPPLLQYCGDYPAQCYPVGVEPSHELIATATIAFSDRKSSGAKNVFDAETVKKRLGPEIGRPAQGARDASER
ncbi:MAG TPA: hypothetical protein VHJ19_02675 [Gammaproteobacteria bacterium]|nr:hypothetical protein [Gammaproteobacteria bacterium]